MNYPILVSPSSRPEIILEFTAPRTARIVQAAERQTKDIGYGSQIGFTSDTWVSIEESFDPSFTATKNYHIRESWASPSIDELRSNLYVQMTYPEYLI